MCIPIKSNRPSKSPSSNGFRVRKPLPRHPQGGEAFRQADRDGQQDPSGSYANRHPCGRHGFLQETHAGRRQHAVGEPEESPLRREGVHGCPSGMEGSHYRGPGHEEPEGRSRQPREYVRTTPDCEEPHPHALDVPQDDHVRPAAVHAR